jgi:hypothetical protein
VSARRIRVSASATVSAAAVAAALFMALALAACGIKSSPQYPEGSVYPRQYPSIEDGRTAPADKAKDDAVSPLGFPYDYPNRPPSR